MPPSAASVVDCWTREESNYEAIPKSTNHAPSKPLTTTMTIPMPMGNRRQWSTIILPWTTGVFVWPLMLTLPLLLSSPLSPISYQTVFPQSWYDETPEDYLDGNSNNDKDSAWPRPLGLILGILAVLVGQVWVVVFFYLFKNGYLSRNGEEPASIQIKGARRYAFSEGLATHVSQPEGFVLLIGYLASTWMFRLMPASYYSFGGTIQWKETIVCLALQDAIQYAMHWLEHVVSPAFYQASHKPHHRFTNPRLFDAFNGSLTDTFCMITLPLFITANIVRSCNVWTYMAFGSTYACWLTLIHSEYTFCWDATFRRLGLGTPADHHVHHAVFKYNYGHLFMWMDQLCGTYKDPRELAPRIFRDNV